MVSRLLSLVDGVVLLVVGFSCDMNDMKRDLTGGSIVDVRCGGSDAWGSIGVQWVGSDDCLDMVFAREDAALLLLTPTALPPPPACKLPLLATLNK